MLTLDLVRVKESGDAVIPRYIAADDPSLLAIAQTLIDIYQEHRGKSRQQLEEAIEVLTEGSKNLLVGRGLSKLLEDRCTFDITCQLEPAIARHTVFELSSQAHKERKFDRRQVLTQAAAHLNITVDILEQILFADLRQNQVLQEFKLIEAGQLLARYNTALAQAVLFKAVSLKIELRDQSQLRYRQLFREIKFCRLLYQITGTPQAGFTILLDGPMSLFQGCQKYGVQMALFLPSLLLCQNWKLEATLRWGKAQRTRYFRLTANDQLYSHYLDAGMYMPPEIAVFEERFRKLDSGWEITSECDFLALGPQEICVPDYAFSDPLSQETIYLEIFGFWRKAALQKRISHIEESKAPLLLAVSQKLSGDKDLEDASLAADKIYYFHEVLNPKEILQRLNQHLRPDA